LEGLVQEGRERAVVDRDTSRAEFASTIDGGAVPLVLTAPLERDRAVVLSDELIRRSITSRTRP